MEVQRTVLGSHPSPLRKTIPTLAERARTIYLSNQEILFLFRDSRPGIPEWVFEHLPTFCLGVSEERLQRLYMELKQDEWLEFDYGRRTLSLCSLKPIA
jgi:hypothetical protein